MVIYPVDSAIQRLNNRGQDKKKKIAVLWSRPPQNVKLGRFRS